VGRYLKEQDPQIGVFAAEPAECPLLTRREWGPHKIEGIGDGFVPRNLDLSLLDGVVTVSSAEAIAMARELAEKEGILAGISSGANLVAARKLAAQVEGIGTIATIINDNGQRYFSTELFGVEKELEVPEREHPLDDYTIEQLDKYQSSWIIVE
jgi:cysteine synthase A